MCELNTWHGYRSVDLDLSLCLINSSNMDASYNSFLQNPLSTRNLGVGSSVNKTLKLVSEVNKFNIFRTKEEKDPEDFCNFIWDAVIFKNQKKGKTKYILDFKSISLCSQGKEIGTTAQKMQTMPNRRLAFFAEVLKKHFSKKHGI